MSYQPDMGYDLIIQKGLDGARVHLRYGGGVQTHTEEYADTDEGHQAITTYKQKALSVKESFLPLPLRLLPKRPFSTAGLIFRLVALCFALVLIGVYINGATFTQRGATSTAKGVILQTKAYRNDDNSQSCSLNIQFTTAQGQDILFTPGGVGDSSQYCVYKVGENVDVTYNTSNPHSAQLAQQNNAWLTNLPILGVGVVVLLGLLLSFKQYKVVNPIAVEDEEEEEDETETV